MSMHLQYGELDLIMEKNGEIIFIEVKTISKKQLGIPKLKVNKQKISKLEKSYRIICNKK